MDLRQVGPSSSAPPAPPLHHLKQVMQKTASLLDRPACEGEHMFITGPSIIEWPLVSAAPEAAAWSQWERRPSTAPFRLLAPRLWNLWNKCIDAVAWGPSASPAVGC